MELRLHVRCDRGRTKDEGAYRDRRIHERGARGRAGDDRELNGPEAIAFELTEWLEAQGAATHRIEPGKPWQNSFAAPLNSRVCDECLGMNGFWSIEHPRVALEAWRTEFNTEHPHSSLGYLMPAEYAEMHPVDPA